LDANLTIIF